MNKRLAASLCAAVLFAGIISSEAAAAEAEVLPAKDGITLSNTSGKIYIHMQNEGSLNITVDKTEPEGVFCYYDTVITSQASKAEGLYLMNLSCCEYLVESGEYASCYTVNFSSAMDKKAVFNQDIVIKDPGFENIDSSEYHFYITMKASAESGCEISDSEEYTSDDGIFICNQYIELSYSNKGDVIEDGIINLLDATAALAIYANQVAGIDSSDFSEAQKKAADMNGDDVVDISDATEILTIYSMRIAGLD